MSTMADSEDYRRRVYRGDDMGYGAPPDMGYGDTPDMGYGAPPDMGYGAPPDMGYGAPPDMGYGAPPDMGYGAPPAYDASPVPRRNRQQRRGSVTERMSFVPDSYVQPTSYSTHTRSYTFQEFMKEPTQQETTSYQTETTEQMEYGYQATSSPARVDFQRDENSYGYENHGYDNPEASNPIQNIVSTSIGDDYGYDTYGYENQDAGSNKATPSPEEDEPTEAEPSAVKPQSMTCMIPALDAEPEEVNRALSPPPSAA